MKYIYLFIKIHVMKKILLVLSISIFTASFGFSQTAPATGAPKTEKKAVKKSAKKGKKMATTYACPMKCVAPSDKPGKCPKCKMDLVEVKQK
jgi:predicted nucleic acid binding AN1-type Zn finger protein